MYNPVNLSVGTSATLMRSQYAIHAGLIVAYLSVAAAYFHIWVLICLLPLCAIQGVYFKKLCQGEWFFCQLRHWQFHNGQARLKRANDWLSVDVRAHQVWPSCVMIRYRELADNPLQKAGSWQWDIIMADACVLECHRQLVALMRQQYQGNEA